jgi:hypothetical protein
MVADLFRARAVRRWRTFNEPGRLTFKDAANREIRIATSYRGVVRRLLPCRVTFKDATGHEIHTPISFRGIAQALAALAKANAAVN